MSRHRNGTVPEGNNNNSSSEEDDVFSALSRKKKGSTGSGKIVTKAKIDDGLNSDAKNDASTCEKTTTVLPPQTSSNKRHHSEVSDARKAKMDALLQELEAERMRAESSEMSSTNKNKNPRHGPERTRGSFVDPGDEYLTTNIFVGNLAPSITEEQMTDLFRQFGEHSYILNKIACWLFQRSAFPLLLCPLFCDKA